MRNSAKGKSVVTQYLDHSFVVVNVEMADDQVVYMYLFPLVEKVGVLPFGQVVIHAVVRSSIYQNLIVPNFQQNTIPLSHVQKEDFQLNYRVTLRNFGK